MQSIDDVFVIHRSRSAAFNKHQPGSIAYVSNGVDDNGVVGYVTPLPEDKVFNTRAIVVSALRDPMVLEPPFIARGSAGSGLLVLEAKRLMKLNELIAAAVLIGHETKWRFHWYRQLTPERLGRVPMIDKIDTEANFSPRRVLPLRGPDSRNMWDLHLEPFRLDNVFELKAGDHHSLADLNEGTSPVVSCKSKNNGIAGYYDVDALYKNRLTIAFNGATLSAKYHHYRFAAKDDVAVCTPLYSLKLSTLLFIMLVLNSEKWRYSYYRKCYLNKLPRLQIKLPSKYGAIDEATIENVLNGAPYWRFIRAQLGS